MISIENVIYYPNKPLNNFELEDAVKKLKIPNFRGVFLLDTLLNKRAMMALNRSPESVSPQNEFYLLYYYCSNL